MYLAAGRNFRRTGFSTDCRTYEITIVRKIEVFGRTEHSAVLKNILQGRQ